MLWISKIEILSSDPLVVYFHDLLSKDTIRKIVEEANPRLEVPRTVSSKDRTIKSTSSKRSGKVAFISHQGHLKVSVLYWYCPRNVLTSNEVWCARYYWFRSTVRPRLVSFFMKEKNSLNVDFGSNLDLEWTYWTYFEHLPTYYWILITSLIRAIFLPILRTKRGHSYCILYKFNRLFLPAPRKI